MTGICNSVRLFAGTHTIFQRPSLGVQSPTQQAVTHTQANQPPVLFVFFFLVVFFLASPRPFLFI